MCVCMNDKAVADNCVCRASPCCYLLLQSRRRARQDRIQGPEDDTTVSPNRVYVRFGALSDTSSCRSISTFQAYYQNALKSVQNPASRNALLQSVSKVAQSPAALLQQAQNVSRAQLVAGGVLAAECIGFFTVGEMIGRFKLIGYHGDKHAAHH